MLWDEDADDGGDNYNADNCQPWGAYHVPSSTLDTFIPVIFSGHLAVLDTGNTVVSKIDT